MSKAKEENPVDEYVHWDGTRNGRFVRKRATVKKLLVDTS